MRLIVTDGVAWSVCLSVGLSVCHDREPYKNRCTDRPVIWDVDSGGVRWGHIGATYAAAMRREVLQYFYS